MSRFSEAADSWRGRLVGGYALVVVLLAAVWVYTLLGPVNDALEDRQREVLVSVANAATVALDSSELPDDEVLGRIAASERLRLTLISSDGEVLAESTETEGMANHAERPEVAAALAGETGFDRRVSTTDGTEYLYVAVPYRVEGELVALRVSMPVDQANAALEQFNWTSSALLVAAVALAVGTAWFSFARTSVPLNRLERMRTDFVANASHELKTPVAGIRLLAESIGQACEAQELDAVAELSQRLDRESIRLQNLVTDLMDLSRLEDEIKPSLREETCDLAAVVATSFEAHRHRAIASGLAFSLDEQNTDTPCRVGLSIANATLLTDNLLDNALAYTERGSVSVRLSHDDHEATLEVVDTGIGVPPADQDRIFERFYRVDTARSREMGGTGLGLSLVRHAVRKGGGTIELDSTLGRGSTFRVTLPLV